MSPTDAFRQIQPLLIDAIPKVIASEAGNEPLAVVRVFYYNTCAPCTYLDFRWLTVESREQLLDRHGENAIYYLWGAAEEGGERPKCEIPYNMPWGVDDQQIAKLFDGIYQRLSMDEEGGMHALRSALQGVTRQLNRIDWSLHCRVADDFVIAPADGSQHFADDYADLVGGIPKQRLELLRERGLLGPGEDWTKRPGFERELSDSERAIEAGRRRIEQQTQAMPPRDRLRYWLGQLNSMAAGKPCDMKKIEAEPYYPLTQIAEMGHATVVPLLRLACKWATTPEYETNSDGSRDWKPMQDVVLGIFDIVRELAVASPQVEILLRHFLRDACQVNEGRSPWGLLPFNCARVLHALFDKYPEPDMAGDNEFINRREFLDAPSP